ncbi:MAG: T9SS type A sorting domain-containing protein [Bacteroidota bacterium]
MNNIVYTLIACFMLSSLSLSAGITVVIEDVDPANMDGTRTVRVKYMSDGTDYMALGGLDDWGSQTLTFGFTPASGATAGLGNITINDAASMFDWNGGFSGDNTPNVFMLSALAGMDDGNFYFTVNVSDTDNVAIPPGGMIVALEFTIPDTWAGDGTAAGGQIFLLDNQPSGIGVNLAPAINNGGTGMNEWDGGAATSDVPVDLVSFDANASNNAIFLDWNSASEINTDRFEIGRSTNGVDFDKIASVAAAGNSLTALNYDYKDANVKANTTYYYQLKMVDLDGTVEYSDVRTASLDGKGDIVSAYPNPAVESLTLTVELASDDDAQILIYDATGKVVYEQARQLEEGTNILNLDIAKLSAGIYRLVVDGKQVRATQNVVIMD